MLKALAVVVSLVSVEACTSDSASEYDGKWRAQAEEGRCAGGVVELKVSGGYVSGLASSPFGTGYLPRTKIGPDGKAAIPIGYTGGDDPLPCIRW
jgi:hypothetical protein